MPRYYAEIVDGVVVRVVVCDDPDWLASRVPGNWVETQFSDPVAAYAGVGHGHDSASEVVFAPQWQQPTGAEDAYPLGAYVYHEGAIWQSQYPANVWEPGVAGWRDPISAVPIWRQPIGAEDAYPADSVVMHGGSKWRYGVPSNVWEPGVYGWVEDAPLGELAVWQQPTGAHDAYSLGAVVVYSGAEWRSIVGANVWTPGVYGWELAE